MKLDTATHLVVCLILTTSMPYALTGATLSHPSCTVRKKDIENIFKNVSQNLKQRLEYETALVNMGRVIKKSDKKPDLSGMWIKMAPLVHFREMAQLPFEEASDQLHKKFGFSAEEISLLPSFLLNGEESKRAKDNCQRLTVSPACDTCSNYRTADGQCNNLQNPKWGSARSCLQRLLPANYEGNSGFRRSINGGKLPSPRDLSLKLHYHLNKPVSSVNHLYMFFGQLLDHDMILTPGSTTVKHQAIECCPRQRQTHHQCAPILIRKDDPFYSKYGITCLNFVRSLICPTCALGSRHQMNHMTSVIDASFIYGSLENVTRALRANDGTGRLRREKSQYGDLLPPSSHPATDGCSIPKTKNICFEAGDTRVNQHTALASLHTIFLREHNRLADDLHLLNPHWDDEKLFQESRHILAAQMQSIVFGDYLPITLGADRMNHFKLWTGNFTRYNPNLNPAMITEFTTAAFRFGHSLVNSVISIGLLNSTKGYRMLRDDFFRTYIIRKGVINHIVGGSSDTSSQMLNEHMVPDVTNYLNRRRGDKAGLDLASINIQRGRDHGLPTYVRMVKYCSGDDIVIRNFRDLIVYGLMDSEKAEALENIYKDVRDVDLWPGILMEIPMPEAVVGFTAACIIGQQFHLLKYGDRFYFEHRNKRVSFSLQQMQEIQKITLTHIICLNTEISELPRNAMLFASEDNPYIDCSCVEGVDLSYWKE